MIITVYLLISRISGYFQESGIWPDIRQVKSGIRPNTGYKKGRAMLKDIPVPVHPKQDLILFLITVFLTIFSTWRNVFNSTG
jgi:hypothetical protein